jgi:large subunit ribosomal protein L21e
MKRSKGSRQGTRNKLRKNVRDEGEPPVTHTLRDFEEGQRVSVRIDSSVHSGMPHPRFQGVTGTVTGTQGDAFTVNFNDGGKQKTLIVGPEHLVPQDEE